MKEDTLLSIFLGAAGAVVIAYLMIKSDEGDVTFETIADWIGLNKGRKLNNTGGRKSGLNAQGYIPEDPYALLNEARAIMGYDIEQDVYALARSGRSEGRNGMEARMHVMMTQAEESGMTVWARTVSEPGNPSNGYFGEQRGRRWASTEDPYEGDIKLAEEVYVQHNNGIDPTGGAGRFADKSSFGKQAGTRTYATVLAEWADEGYYAYYFPDASHDFVLFRRHGVPDGFESA